MASNKVFKGDVGTLIILDCVQNIADASLRKIKVVRPDKTTTEWPALPEGTTKIKYTIMENDFNMAGRYMIQAYIEASGWKGRGEWTYIDVQDTKNV